MAWLLLVLAGLFEVGFTTAMQLMKGSRSWAPTLGFLVCITASFLLLQRATETIPVGTAYAVWTGIGAAGTIVVGALLFGETVSAVRMALLLVLIASVVGLKLTH